MEKVSYLQDIVVDHKYRNRNIGERIVKYLTNKSNELQCYKVVLNCSDMNREFYKKCGYSKKGNEMSIYFTQNKYK